MTRLILIPIGIAAGALLGRSGILPARTPRLLNQAIIFISLPAITLLQIQKLHTVDFAPASMAWIARAGTSSANPANSVAGCGSALPTRSTKERNLSTPERFFAAVAMIAPIEGSGAKKAG